MQTNNFKSAHCPRPIDGMGIESLQPFSQFMMGIRGKPSFKAQCNSWIGAQWSQVDTINFTFAPLAQFREQACKGFIPCTSRVRLGDLGDGYWRDRRDVKLTDRSQQASTGLYRRPLPPTERDRNGSTSNTFQKVLTKEHG